MFIQLCKQTWFVMLMVFAIGWSGVSVASVNSMQISMQMQHEQTSKDHQSMMQQMTVQEMKAHCNDLQQQAVSGNANLSHIQQMQGLKDCHTQLLQSKHAQHIDCQNCALFSCQSSIVWFNTDIPKLIIPEDHLEQNSLQVHYQAQHLAGYWQEILRPPKA